MKNKRLEVLFWSIAFPGFGQLLNHQFLKGIFFILLEVIINVYSHFNTAILFSFKGKISEAVEITDYQWLMFYPCIYTFAIWDAYKQAGADSDTPPLSFLPFAFSAYFVTIGVIYSAEFKVNGMLLGPIWLPILFLIPGIGIGLLVRTIMLRFTAV
ncbi:hypothetical protein [Halobacillus sp. B23F22_1]|uniref:hypothetical protein n=1 Tax=Halobacillus sp. B23F22_1 TaxID=3459514 RepID=UPI00373F6766